MNIWRPVAILALVWATAATGLWVRGLHQAQHRVVLSPLGADEPALEALELGAFVRQFQERLYNYDHTSFTPGQTALTFLMSEPLRRRQLDELRKRSGARSRDFQQSSRLQRVRTLSQGTLLAEGLLVGREDRSSWQVAYALTLEVSRIPRTIENPWGWEVSAMHIKTQAGKPATTSPTALNLSKRSPLVLGFPCIVRHIQAPKNLPVRMKLTSMNVSEVQLHREEGDWTPAAIEARCDEMVFPLVVQPADGDEFDLHVELWKENSISKRLADRTKRRNQAYQKNLEDELGFIVED